MAALSPVDRWTAAHCRACRGLFAVCGRAGASGIGSGAAIALTEVSGQFAWHAELFFGLLPVRDGVDREALVSEPARGVDEVIDQLGAAADRADAAAMCLVVARVVAPRLRAGVLDALSSTAAALDGPRHRALTLVARDLVDAVSVLEPAAERLVAGGGTLEAAAEACVAAERSLIAAGAVIGLVAPEQGRGG